MLVSLTGVAAVAAGCGGSAVLPRGPVDLPKLRESNIPVYYLGRSFSGLDLTYADTPNENGVLVAYGTCKAESGRLLHATAGDPDVRELRDRRPARAAGTRRAGRRSLRPLNEAARGIANPRLKINKGPRCR